MESKTPTESKLSTSTSEREGGEILFSTKSKDKGEIAIELKRCHFTDESLVIINRTNLTCPICFLLFTNPKQVESCGHIFCEDCINKSLISDVANEYSRCPVCRKKVEKLVNDNSIKKIVTGLIVYCKYRRRGCSWQNAMGNDASDYIRHITSCPMRGKNCEQGCGIVVEWNEEKKHRQNDCPLTLIKCRYDECPDSIVRKNFGKHVINCDYRPVDCEFKYISSREIPACAVKIQYRHYRKHLTDYAIDHCRAANAAHEEVKKKLQSEERARQEEKKAREDLYRRLTDEKEKLLGEKRRAEEKVSELEKKAKIINRHRWVIKDWSVKIKKSCRLETSDFCIWGQVCKMKVVEHKLSYYVGFSFPNIASPLYVDYSIDLVDPKNGNRITYNDYNVKLFEDDWCGPEITKEIFGFAYDEESDSIYVDLLIKEEPRPE